MKLGVVMPVGAGREANVKDSLASVLSQNVEAVLCVMDGVSVPTPEFPRSDSPTYAIWIDKHQPGDMQPRNVGVLALLEKHPDLTHVWFVDSDIIFEPDASAAYERASLRHGDDCILIGPYEWMAPGVRDLSPTLYNDPRWAMFHEMPRRHSVADLGVALGCFSGNLVYPVEAFQRIGGFHPELHHGRCEDGELGLRAAAAEIPMVLVPLARGYHIHHEVNHVLVSQRNQRDVPILNRMHPWVQEKGLIVTHKDGARFDFVCSVCHEQINSLEIWRHIESRHAGNYPVIYPGPRND